LLKFAADENFNNRILRALHRFAPELDIVRIQDTVAFGKDDPAVLAWAAQESRLLLTHDIQTMPDFAYARIASGLVMTGVVEVNDRAPLVNIIEDIVLLAQASSASEWDGQVIFVPFPRKNR
jgi:predicted nuclease of predicted toxin-antitoxin system